MFKKNPAGLEFAISKMKIETKQYEKPKQMLSNNCNMCWSIHNSMNSRWFLFIVLTLIFYHCDGFVI